MEKLEYDGKGLNLTLEVRDGIYRHSKGRGEILEIKPKDKPRTLEGQIVRVSDVIAYVNHDIDDALRAGIIKEDDIPAHLVKTFGRWHASRIDRMVEDVVKASLKCGLERMWPVHDTVISRIREMESSVDNWMTDVGRLWLQIRDMQEVISKNSQELEQIRNSLSWRLTKPLRVNTNTFRKLLLQAGTWIHKGFSVIELRQFSWNL